MTDDGLRAGIKRIAHGARAHSRSNSCRPRKRGSAAPRRSCCRFVPGSACRWPTLLPGADSGLVDPDMGAEARSVAAARVPSRRNLVDVDSLDRDAPVVLDRGLSIRPDCADDVRPSKLGTQLADPSDPRVFLRIVRNEHQDAAEWIELRACVEPSTEPARLSRADSVDMSRRCRRACRGTGGSRTNQDGVRPGTIGARRRAVRPSLRSRRSARQRQLVLGEVAAEEVTVETGGLSPARGTRRASRRARSGTPHRPC